jgi:CRP-like cAMP-binding protein
MSITDIFPIEKWDFMRKSILSGLLADEMNSLMENRVEKLYRKGEVIIREGTVPEYVYYIIEGVVKKFKLSDSFKETIFYVANDGEMIGYRAVINGERYYDGATALEDSKIALIPKNFFLNVLSKSPVFTNHLLRILSHEFSVMVNGINLVTQKPVRERMALQLILLREKYKTDFQPGMVVTITVSREDLGALVGAATEHAIRVLMDFKKEGILETKGSKILIHDIEQLIKIAGCY